MFEQFRQQEAIARLQGEKVTSAWSAKDGGDKAGKPPRPREAKGGGDKDAEYE